MTKSEKRKIIQFNTISWIVAMILPAVFYFALQSTQFPWPLVYPLLLIGFLLHSNRVLNRTITESIEEPLATEI